MKLLRLMALAAFLPSAALAAAPMETSQLVDGSGVPIGTFANPLFVSGGGGGGGGSSGPAYVGQFNSTLPTFASGQAGYLSVDSNGRLLVSPSSSILADLRIGGTSASSSNPVPASDGTDGTGTNPGTGARGWLSGIYARLGGTLNVVIGAGSNTIGAVTQAGTWAVNATLQTGSAIIGRVGIDQTTPGVTNAVFMTNQFTQTTTGAQQPPTAGTGKINKIVTDLAANTNTQIAPANSNRYFYAIQCGNVAGTSAAATAIDENNTTLTAAQLGSGTLFIPASTSMPPYFTPPIASQNQINAYTGTAQRCVVLEYLR